MSESSDAEQPRPAQRSLRPHRSLGMRRRHHNGADSRSVSRRSQTDAHQRDVQMRLAATTSRTSVPASLSSSPTISLTSATCGLSNSNSLSTSLSSQCPVSVPETRRQSDTAMSRTGPGNTVGVATPGQESGPSNPVSTGLPVDQQQILEETIIAVKVPMMRPNPFLLQVIRAAGGIGDVFTMRQIIHHVKNYIGQRVMYDQRNPSITYCDGDLLGKALGVKQFTILEAIGLFHRNCTLVQDSCIRMRRHVEPRQATGSIDHSMVRDSVEDRSAATRSTGPVPDHASTILERSSYREPVSLPDSSLSQPSQGLQSVECLSSCDLSSGRSEGSFVLTPPASQETVYSTTDYTMNTSSSTASQESTSCPSHSEISSSFGSQDIGPSVSQRASKSCVNLSDHDLRSPQSDQQYSIDSSSDGSNPGSLKQESKTAAIKQRTSPRRMPGTSIDVLLDEPDGNSGPWECRVRVHTSHSASDLNGSTAENAEDDTVVLEYESDNFSVEYELASSSDEQEGGEQTFKETNDGSSRARSVSETSSHSSGLGTGTALLVVCKESDVEYLADYSDTDTGSDAELSEGDKWVCSYCNIKNPPFQRNCGGCWSVRFDWLPSTSNLGTKSAICDADQATYRDNNEVAKSLEVPETDVQKHSISQDHTLSSKAGFSGCAIDSISPAPGSTRVSLKEACSLIVTSSSDDGPQISSQTLLKASEVCRRNPQNENQTSAVVGSDLKTLKADAFKAMAAASKLRAKKRQYSSGLSTSDSQDDCPKNKSKPQEIKDMSCEGAKSDRADKSVKSTSTNEQSPARPRKQKPSFYSERTLGVLSRNEACVVCLVRPKTASIIHGKTGHQVCCYHCAKKLKKQRRACPICRRPIQRVIRNYHL
ncbi:hypothetical protein RRG08_041677 [Elysia crispata]|uniref:RING-type E3 ubiquitin transferase Mdm2 n=1 Tax=Elysia crispata TaxID=231223 RepID=A0AAE1CVU2_9GAST|nr:hypothetical protein RRG08_041677 [Elysia crispata]